MTAATSSPDVLARLRQALILATTEYTQKLLEYNASEEAWLLRGAVDALLGPPAHLSLGAGGNAYLAGHAALTAALEALAHDSSARATELTSQPIAASIASSSEETK